MAPKRPVLRYHGGKYMLAPWIVSHLPPHRIYCEPFGGAGSVLMRKPRAYADVYNDLDGEVVNLFRVLRDRVSAAELERLLRLTPFAREEFDRSYEVAEEPIERARRLVVRCFMGFGSTAHNSAARTGFRSKSYRRNQTGSQDWANYPDAIPAMSERLQGCLIEHTNALDLIPRHDSPETVFYVDPPYPHASRSSLTEGRGRVTDGMHCYRHEMTDDDHRALAEALRSVQGMVVLSGYRCDLYADLYHDWHSVERQALADGARPRTEVLWLSPAAVAGTGQGVMSL